MSAEGCLWPCLKNLPWKRQLSMTYERPRRGSPLGSVTLAASRPFSPTMISNSIISSKFQYEACEHYQKLPNELPLGRYKVHAAF